MQNYGLFFTCDEHNFILQGGCHLVWEFSYLYKQKILIVTSLSTEIIRKNWLWRFRVGLHHRSVHVPVKPKTQAKPNNGENTCTKQSNEIPLFNCTKESMKYLARIIVYWTKSTSGPVFFVRKRWKFHILLLLLYLFACVSMIDWLIMPSPMAMVSSPSSSHESYSLLSTLVFLWVWLKSLNYDRVEWAKQWVSGKLYLYLCCECHLNVWSINELGVGRVRDWSVSWAVSHICLRDSLSMNCVWGL